MTELELCGLMKKYQLLKDIIYNTRTLSKFNQKVILTALKNYEDIKYEQRKDKKDNT